MPVRTGHAGSLLPLIDTLFSLSPYKKEEVDLVAVGIGPGSFTGIRIGIATAKGLSTALGCALAGISTLDALARGAAPSPLPVLPVIDARKSEVFCALYAPDGSPLTPPANVRPEGLASLVASPTLFIGNAVPLYREIFFRILGSNYVEGPEDLWYPRASVVGRMAVAQRDEGTLAPARPLYVRASDAEIKVKR